MSAWSIALSPFLPWPAIYVLAAAALAVSAALIWRGVRGAWLRALSMALLLLALLDPVVKLPSADHSSCQRPAGSAGMR